MLSLAIKNIVFTLVVPATVAVYVPLWIKGDAVPAPGPWRIVAIIFFAIGVSIYTWCVWDFATAGRGTPAPIDAPKRLVVRGLYRYVRNPMYLGVLTTIFGWACWYTADRLVGYAVIVATLFHLVVVYYEEPTLQRTFGSDYDEYRRRVPRWLPRINARS